MTMMVELAGVTKMYRDVIGVNDLTLDLATQAYGLIGPNGSGKTTLINLLIGQLRPTLGRVRVFGVTPSRDRRVLRRIGLCPATDVLYPNVTALDFVTYQVRLHGIDRRECRRLAMAALETVGMEAAMRRPMGTYSLGMRQRTKIAQAIAHEPDLLILDEPYNGLDPIGRSDMTRLLKGWAEAGRGLIFASHVLQEIETITSSFLLIFGGRLLASGAAEDIESMLLATPQEIRIVGPDAAKLIYRLAEVEWVESLQLAHAPVELRVSLRDPSQFYARIAGWIVEDGLRIHGIASTAGNLTTIFESLLKHHRGETL